MNIILLLQLPEV